MENQPGRIYRVLNALAEADINLRAMTVSEKAGSGLLRLIVSDTPRARQLLMNMQQPAEVHEVIAARLEDRPGSLAAVLQSLVAARVTVEYLYAFALPTGSAVTVLGTTDNDRCEEILRDRDVAGVDMSTLFGSSR